MAPCPSSGLIIHGDKDSIASFESARILSEKLQKQKKVDVTFKTIKGADHFYENHKSEFISVVNDYINKKLNKKVFYLKKNEHYLSKHFSSYLETQTRTGYQPGGPSVVRSHTGPRVHNTGAVNLLKKVEK